MFEHKSIDAGNNVQRTENIDMVQRLFTRWKSIKQDTANETQMIQQQKRDHIGRRKFLILKNKRNLQTLV